MTKMKMSLWSKNLITTTWMLFHERVNMSGEHMNMNKWAQGNLFRNILLTSTKYYLTHMIEYLWHGRILCHVSWMNDFLGWKRMINKMDENFNEFWQQIKLHFSPSISFSNIYLKLHLFHPYCLIEYFILLPCFTSLLLPYMPSIHVDIQQ
jgi:hypothetical protein